MMVKRWGVGGKREREREVSMKTQQAANEYEVTFEPEVFFGDFLGVEPFGGLETGAGSFLGGLPFFGVFGFADFLGDWSFFGDDLGVSASMSGSVSGSGKGGLTTPENTKSPCSPMVIFPCMVNIKKYDLLGSQQRGRVQIGMCTTGHFHEMAHSVWPF